MLQISNISFSRQYLTRNPPKRTVRQEIVGTGKRGSRAAKSHDSVKVGNLVDQLSTYLKRVEVAYE